MRSFYGLNCLGQVKSEREYLDYHAKAEPPFTLLLEAVGLARQVKTASPSTNVILRAGFPDGAWVRQSPSKLLNYWRSQIGIEDFWCYCDNEVGLALDWHIELIKTNASSAHPLKLVILNTSVGTPQPDEWKQPKALELLRLCDQYRAWCIVGIHEYWNITPTSGMIGGYPDRAGAQPDMTKQAGDGGRNLVPVTNWPGKPEVDTLTKFHVGRFNFMVEVCKANGIKPPRVLITECGQDDVSDIKQWVLRQFGEGIRGFKTALQAWRRIYPQWTEDEAYANMFGYVANNIYAGTCVEGALPYCYGSNGDPLWDQFDIQGRSGLLSLLANIDVSKKVVDKPVEVPPVVVTPPVKPEVVTQTGTTPVVKDEPAATRYKMYMFVKEVTLSPVALKELVDQGFVFYSLKEN